MKKNVWGIMLVVFSLCFVACQNKEEQAAEAALEYYGYLLEGEYERYVDGIAYSDKMIEKYKKQLMELSAQYMYREKKLHGGLKDVTYLSGIFADSVANVLLELHYNDSTSEEISVPMILCDDQWKLQ